jgi:hypothetical protein
MNTHVIAIEIDETMLASYTDKYLAVCWHAAQHNPAPYGDYLAGELTEHIAREIIRRWLSTVPPELWHHQGRHNAQKELSRFATYEPGGPVRDLRDTRAFHSGRWVPRMGAAGQEPENPATAAPEEE